jgi:hypothetical protein
MLKNPAPKFYPKIIKSGEDVFIYPLHCKENREKRFRTGKIV